jgi:hypothetical protein
MIFMDAPQQTAAPHDPLLSPTRGRAITFGAAARCSLSPQAERGGGYRQMRLRCRVGEGREGDNGSRAVPFDGSARCGGEVIEVAVLGQQLGKPSAGVEHPRFNGVLRHPDDLGDFLDGLVVIVDEIDDLAVVG